MTAIPWGMASSSAEPGGRAAPDPGWTEIAGPIGPLYVAWSADGLTDVEAAGDPADFELLLSERGRAVHRVRDVPGAWAAVVRRAARGERAVDLPLDLRGRSAFEAACQRVALTIPRGEVRPYAWVARGAGRPRAVRAAGAAMAATTVGPLVPCHRVGRSDGRVGGFGSGGDVEKRALLRAEGVDPDALDALAGRGIRYLGAPAAMTFHYPTCGRLRDLPDGDRTPLRSGEAAVDAGFRPCPTCRPTVTSPFA